MTIGVVTVSCGTPGGTEIEGPTGRAREAHPATARRRSAIDEASVAVATLELRRTGGHAVLVAEARDEGVRYMLACKPGSVGSGIRMIIPLGALSPVCSSSQPAASWSRRTVSRRLFGLAPAGVYRAATVTSDAVGSYPTISPLPTPKRRRFVFCGTFRRSGELRPGVTWQLVQGARTFLGEGSLPTSTRSSGQHVPDPCNIAVQVERTSGSESRQNRVARQGIA